MPSKQIPGSQAPRIYVDTSVLGGCFDREFRVWSNALMNEFRAGVFRHVLSVVTFEEVRRAPPRVRTLFRELRTISEFLGWNPETDRLTQAYLERQILPHRYFEDCAHIALASVYKVDFLVSWNFRHIVNFDKMNLFSKVNVDFGYPVLSIHSPRKVVSRG